MAREMPSPDFLGHITAAIEARRAELQRELDALGRAHEALTAKPPTRRRKAPAKATRRKRVTT